MSAARSSWHPRRAASPGRPPPGKNHSRLPSALPRSAGGARRAASRTLVVSCTMPSLRRRGPPGMAKEVVAPALPPVPTSLPVHQGGRPVAASCFRRSSPGSRVRWGSLCTSCAPSRLRRPMGYPRLRLSRRESALMAALRPLSFTIRLEGRQRSGPRTTQGPCARGRSRWSAGPSSAAGYPCWSSRRGRRRRRAFAAGSGRQAPRAL